MDRSALVPPFYLLKLSFLSLSHYFRARRFHEFKESTKNDVIMSLEEIETVKYGQPYSIRVKLHNVSNKSRTLKVMVKTSSVQYNGVSGHLIRKSSGEFVMGPGQST